MKCGICGKKVAKKNSVIYRWRASGNPVWVHEGCDWQVGNDTRVVKVV